MFKSVRIQNFRQFRDLKLDNLAQINLITGKNDTGKTSLLEALLLHVSPSNPEMVLTIADQRGMASVLADGPGAWGWIFRESDDSGTITIESVDSMNNRMSPNGPHPQPPLTVPAAGEGLSGLYAPDEQLRQPRDELPGFLLGSERCQPVLTLLLGDRTDLNGCLGC